MAVFTANIQRDVEIELDAALEEPDFQNDGGIDMTAALRQMRELDEAAGDWKDHLPYEAAISYLVDDAVREQLEEHVSGCQFCRDMIDALNPRSKVLGELHQTAYDVYTDAPESDSPDLPKEDYWT